MPLFDIRSYRWSVALLLGSSVCSQQLPPVSAPVQLQVDQGTPLRLYLTKRTFFKKGAPVSAKLIEPLWAFDRVVVPAGASLRGSIADLVPVTKGARLRAILGGDLTPLKLAQVSFSTLTLPDGQVRDLSTGRSIGLKTIYVERKPPQNAVAPKPTAANGSSLVRKVRSQVQTTIRGQRDSVIDFVRGQNKVEWVEEFVLQKLPYHPQWYRARTRIDAVLETPINFGQATVAADDSSQVGEIPSADTTAQLRLATTIDSGSAKVGDPLDAVLAKPVFTNDRKLLLPVGTTFSGKVTLVQPARYWHRSGKIRFVFDHLTVPNIAGLDLAKSPKLVQTQLSAIEADPGLIKVDPEGTVKANDSKARLIRPLVAAFIAGRSADDDADRNRNINGSSNGNSNLAGRTLGGFSGFGLLGTATSLGPKWIGATFGYYGLAFSVYANIIGKGMELGFEKNTATEIRFGAAARPTK